MKQRKKSELLKRECIVYCGKQIWIQRLQKSKNGSNICIIISNGYTAQCTALTNGYKVGKRDEPDISMFNQDVEILACYYKPECCGLKPSTEELKDFLEKTSVGKELWLIGHSKSAQPMINIQREMIPCYDDINVVTVSPAFGGTCLSSKKEFLEVPKRFSFVSKILWKIAFQDIQVEKDVATDSEYIRIYYDSSRLVTVNYVTKLMNLKNIQDLEGLANYFLNWILKYEERQGGDGIVHVQSQTLGVEASRIKFLNCPHCHGLADACYDLIKKFPHLASMSK